MKQRKACVKRQTKETNVSVDINLDGNGRYTIDTSIPFFDHMLCALSKHSAVDLKIHARGDIEIDEHHTVEDVGISLGQAFKKALKEDYQKITRYGCFSLAMEESLVDVALDISGRPFLYYHLPTKTSSIKTFELDLLEEFWRAFCNHMGLNLHIHLRVGKNAHHIHEASFKGVARSLRMALHLDEKLGKEGVSSTKGCLDS